MRKIIVINGAGASGKDEVFEITKKLIDGKYVVVNISSVTAVKLKAMSFGWNGKKDDKSRRLLSDLKDAWTRYNDGPFKDIKQYIQHFHTSKNFLIFVHIRECEEIKKIIDYYGNLVVTLLIRRPNTEKFNNHADSDVENYPYDYIIENNGTLDDLKENVKIFLNDIGVISSIEYS